MRFLPPHRITDLYCLVDDLAAKPTAPRRGRPPALSPSEVVTMLVWNTLTVRQQTLRDVYGWINRYHRSEFPKLPPYNRFVDHCHKAFPLLLVVLQHTLATDAPLKFMDSTMLEVCRMVRMDRHTVAAGIADLGKNHQGWHYGFKLHASIDPHGRFSGLVFTPANFADPQAMPMILNEQTRVAVGDTLYGARVMGRSIWEHYGTIVIAPPHYKQNKKIMAWWQYKLLTMRPKIESVFGYLKEHLHLVSSFPRSVMGYFLHYVRVLLGYQFLLG